VESDLLNFALEAILSQLGDDKKLHPVAFYSRKISAVEINYKIHVKELLTIVDSFKEWRHFLKGASHLMNLYIDKKNFEYFMSTCILNHCKAHWNMSLSQFDFAIT